VGGTIRSLKKFQLLYRSIIRLQLIKKNRIKEVTKKLPRHDLIMSLSIHTLKCGYELLIFFLKKQLFFLVQ
jgi:hypothetical protein